MTPDEIRQLRRELRCTPRELADSIAVEFETIIAWEHEQAFPTKQSIDRMEELRRKGPDAVVRTRRKLATTPLEALDDPETWRLFRKLLAHPELRKAALALAERYDDPV
jgi:DNA-binding XRE family transcriptional regulator